MFSVLNLLKPPHMTSHDVVSRVRKVFNIQKVGHLGTLDPLATGVLPVCIGKATRLIEYFPNDKAYQATIELGRQTDSLDSEGEFTTDTPCPALTQADILKVLPRFMGLITQQVPRYSAVHVKGKKLYHYARQGVVVPTEDLPSREVELFDLELVSFVPGEYPVLTLQVHCSSGTYMRSLARDIGEAVGTVAYLKNLVRTNHGQYGLDTAVALDTLMTSETPLQYLLNPLEFLTLPQVFVSNEALQALINGMTVDCPVLNDRIKGNSLLIARNRDFMAGVVEKSGFKLKPVKILNQSLKENRVASESPQLA
jgi:tRNA pseudouridine55 synthase